MMKKINKTAIFFALILISSLGFAGNVRAGIIDTLNISIQNPPTPPAPPKKPEPPLPPNVPTLPPTSTPVPTNNPTPVPTNPPENSNGGSSGSSSGSSSGGSSAPAGQVLGASTMAGTGSFDEDAYLAIMALGGTLSALGIKNFKKSN